MLIIENSKPENGKQTNLDNSRPLVKTKGEVKEIEPVTWDYMLDELKIPQPDLIHWHAAKSPCNVNGRAAYLVRFFNFDKAGEKGLKIKDYESLNEHPEMIEHEGYYVLGGGGEVIVKKWEGAEKSFLEERTKNLVITEKGLETQKPVIRKWISLIGNFMIMGAFVLVLVVIAILVLAISFWLKGS